MKIFVWEEGKNKLLRQERGISFEEIVFHINNGDLLARLDHPNRTKYSHQQVFVVLANDYVYMVPFVENLQGYFLKTIIPSRKFKRDYSKRKGQI